MIAAILKCDDDSRACETSEKLALIPVCPIVHKGTLMKVRLDKLLLERQLAPTREKAQALILAGRVLVNEQKIDKPGSSVTDDAAIRILGDDLRYVSRGGFKLEARFHWP